MVGIVIVSHSKKVAEGVAELAGAMAENVKIAAAGGLPDGSLGTDFERIKAAIEAVYGEDGAAIFVDMGSALMTTEMVLEDLEGYELKIADAPVAEGAVLAAVEAACGADLEGVISRAEEARAATKFTE